MKIMNKSHLADLPLVKSTSAQGHRQTLGHTRQVGFFFPKAWPMAWLLAMSIAGFVGCTSHANVETPSASAGDTTVQASRRDEDLRKQEADAELRERQKQQKEEAVQKTEASDAIKDVMARSGALEVALKGELQAVKGQDAGAFDQLVKLIGDYVGQAKALSTQACPGDFAEAYYRHISTWSFLAEGISEHPEILNDDEAFWDGFLNGLHGDITGGVVQRKDAAKRWMGDMQARNAEVTKTESEMEALSIRYKHIADDANTEARNLP